MPQVYVQTPGTTALLGRECQDETLHFSDEVMWISQVSRIF